MKKMRTIPLLTGRSSHVVGFDIDSDAVKVARSNCECLETNVDFVLCDVTDTNFLLRQGCVDTIVMNPPFGTKDKPGVDVVFLKVASQVRSFMVDYSLLLTRFRGLYQQYILFIKLPPETYVASSLLISIRFL